MKKYLWLAALGMLSACASSADNNTHYHQLPDSAFHAPTQRNNEVAIQIVLAEPLKNENLLYQTDDYHLNFAQKNLWAAPLSDALAANLANKLNAFSGSHTYVPQPLADSKASILKVYFDRFQGTYRGETQISGYAQSANGARRPFVIATPQRGDGYTAMLDRSCANYCTIRIFRLPENANETFAPQSHQPRGLYPFQAAWSLQNHLIKSLG